VGQGRGAAAAIARGFGDLPHLRLGHQDDVERDLPENAGEEREHTPDLHHGEPGRVPRDGGLREVQLPSKLPKNGDTATAQRG
jgi:hypothetical protein